jgi:hypothetical protein
MIRTSALLLLALGLGACASQIGYHAGDLQAANEQLGQAVQQNITAQTVNPQGSSEPIVASGARTAKAVAAYQTDKVEKPKSASTTAVEATSGATGGN